MQEKTHPKSSAASGLLAEVLEAHGGLERWRSTRDVRAHARSGGLLLKSRFPRGAFADYEIHVEVGTPRVAFSRCFRDPGLRGVFEAGKVWIESKDEDRIAVREDPRGFFHGFTGLRRNVRWDALDATYFAGYAMWNYLTTPYLLTRDGMEVREGDAWSEKGETWRRLEVAFPDGVDTHSGNQAFYVDDNGLIRRHDYIAEPVGGWASAAHYCSDHREFDGLVLPTSRRVVPRGPGNRALPGPTLVWIELDRVHVT